MNKKILEITNESRERVNDFLIANWYSTDMSVRGKIIDGTKLDGFIIEEKNEIIGLITYMFYDNICEIISLDSKRENMGIGSMLLNKLEKFAKEKNATKMRLVTTNDNLRAQHFYQKRGYHITKVYENAMDEVRKLKPDLPLIGENGIPLRDEIEFEKDL